ncbi:pyruvate kinase [Kistimonas scapharcae]|uniref:Pyruvate kinase n=1 Tax=Kistimonas scapharcae TaxID=1036133 RepID=A0ABP8V4Y4_9GAMM
MSERTVAMPRRTKIVATLGPATDDQAALTALIEAGVNVVRLNFSHGTPEELQQRVDRVRETASQLGRAVALMGDLQGPKIRIARFAKGGITLAEGDHFILDADVDKTAGDQHRVGLTYEALPNDCATGDMLLLDDGRITMRVERVDGRQIHCHVVNGGELTNSKGINRQGGGLSAPALTDKDRDDIQTAAKLDLDYLAVSFPRCAADLALARQLLHDAGGEAAIMAKIERAEVVKDEKVLEEVILASDAVMVARGDLGVEIGDAELIGVQKKIIAEARRLNRPVVTATQMMESMITNSLPTRAEVFDVANAVLDGTDAVMLSAESATGANPGRVVEAMGRICLGAEKQPATQVSTHRMAFSFERTDETIAMSTMYAANHLQSVKAIICLTESGSTPLWMSRINSRLPIFALTRQESTRRRVALYRGVEAFVFDPTIYTSGHEVNAAAVKIVRDAGYLEDGDQVIMTKGDTLAVVGETNTMKILTV